MDESAPEHELTQQQEQAIDALLTTHTIRAAAVKAGVGYSSLRKWLKDPIFSAAYAESKREIIRNTVHCLEMATEEGLRALRRLFKSRNPVTVLKAVALLFEARNESVNQVDVIGRLKALEDRANGPSVA